MCKLWKTFLWTGMLTALLLFASAAWAVSLTQSAEEGKQIFEQKCAGCHTIGGGRLVGPDLQGVTAERDRAWLEKFIRDPNVLFAAGDPDAKALLAEYQVPMPALGLSNEEIQAVLAYLETTASQQGEAGAAATAEGAPSAAPPKALERGDPLWGRRLFTGEQPFANGGQACMACHSAAGVGPLGGGTMGPDLTHVFARYGQQGLASALATLPFPVMQEVYADRPLTQAEQVHLLAFFEWADAGDAGKDSTQNTFVFLGLGVAGTILLFGLLALGWPRQRESLSDQLRRQA